MNANRIKLSVFRWEEPLRIFVLLLLLWTFGPIAIRWMDDTAGSVDQSIWLLILLSLISFLLVTALSWWILKLAWANIGLPPILIMVSRFNNLEIWHQALFFLVSFGLLLLAATGCLIALC
ncbi:hypothetical protein QG516_13215 [Pedobacter gandavensis]|uniref:hypothetical protein n=1 Tax=Pedobacter TaxID=84567 RepID=UPI001C99928D|nr:MULTISPECIES: hypothetical protein [Pedobacter]WGQ07527.1 hypothetical protein QG516_13215 [Pedobacter gandavensis]